MSPKTVRGRRRRTTLRPVSLRSTPIPAWASRLVDAAPAVVLAGLAGWGLLTSPDTYADPLPVSAVLLVGAALALAARRRAPTVTALVAAGLVSTYLLGLTEDLSKQPPFEPFIILVVAFFALGLHGSGRTRVIGALLGGGAVVAAEGVMVASGRPVADVAPSLVFWTAAGLLGAAVRHYRTAAHVAVEEARTVASRRDEELAAAVTAERARLASELHDVVAHGLSVIVIQAGVDARLHARQHPEIARTLATIEDTGRSALADLRRLLGLLRADPGEDLTREPLPTLSDLEEIVGRVRAAGHRIELSVSGDVHDVPPGVGLAVCRITQEALTNAVKHAPGSSVRVEVTSGPDGVVVDVQDDGPAERTPLPAELSSGHGLLSMRERVRLYAGRLEAGPREQGGFGVRASLPFRAAG